MNQRFREKVTMRFNISQLDRVIVTLLNNGHNKKFAGNITRLFSMFTEESYKNDFEKEIRVILISKISSVVIEKDINTKDSILTFLDISGKYENELTELLNNLFNIEIEEAEITALDKLISQQLRYSIIGEEAVELNDMLTNLQTDNYDDFEDFIDGFHESLDGLNKKLRSARESIEDSKQDISLGSDSFVNVLDRIIKQDRSPSAKVKTGIKFINEAFNGGYEKGRVYLALGLAKGWKS
jgi:hypothetical protein